jgi:hypothetical protein
LAPDPGVCVTNLPPFVFALFAAIFNIKPLQHSGQRRPVWPEKRQKATENDKKFQKYHVIERFLLLYIMFT